MLWLIVGIVLSVMTLAGASLARPIPFAIGALALLAFSTGSRERSTL